MFDFLSKGQTEIFFTVVVSVVLTFNLLLLMSVVCLFFFVNERLWDCRLGAVRNFIRHGQTEPPSKSPHTVNKLNTQASVKPL